MTHLIHDRLIQIWHTGQRNPGGQLGHHVPPLGEWDTLEWRLWMQTQIPLSDILLVVFNNGGSETMALASLAIGKTSRYRHGDWIKFLLATSSQETDTV